MDRRTLLVSTGFVLSLPVAGCVGGNGQGASTPVAAVEMYFQALDDGDRETANQYAHEDGEYHLPADSSNHIHRVLHGTETVTVFKLEQIDRETAVRKRWYRTLSHGDPVANPDGPHDVGDERVDRTLQRERAAVTELLHEYDFAAHAYVWYTVETGDSSHTMPVLLVNVDDEWLLWSPRPNVVWF